MREGLDQWEFVILAYVVAGVGTLAMLGWSWLTMRRAEARRDKMREQVKRK